jgi:Family of unknown function (DUF6526)
MSNAPQGLHNHARFDPPFHFLTSGLYIANLVVAITSEVHHHDFGSTWYLVLSLFAIVPILKLRLYPLKVQDRVIRLEERLRLQALAPAPWHAQIFRLSEDQLIGLRFAGDDEVVELAKQALEHNLTRKQIKERIKNWRPDEWRV